MLTDLSPYTGLFSGYTELRCQENTGLTIAFLQGDNITNTKTSSGGVCARVYQSGSWGFASCPALTSEGIRFVIATATKNAAFLDQKEQKASGQLPSSVDQTRQDYSTTKPRLTQNQLVEFMKELDRYIAGRYPQLASRLVSLNCSEQKKSLITADGSSAYSLLPHSFIRVSLTVEKDGEPVSLGETYGGRGHFEDLFTHPEALFPEIDQLVEHLMQKRDGIHPAAGWKTCILAPEIAGILAHEAIGHTAEADLVLAGSVAGPYLNKEVASSLVTMVDFAHTAFGETCPVPVLVDDEGTKAEDCTLIEEGILKGFMHNKESARRFGVSPTGNARANNFMDEPLIRMRNTAILPGKDNLAEMIASVDDGYYLLRTSNGQADATSEFMFGITLGYEIKQGKLGRAIKDTTVSGVAYTMLKTVSMISKEFKWLSSGKCGKKQSISVGLGGPALKCELKIGGR